MKHELNLRCVLDYVSIRHDERHAEVSVNSRISDEEECRPDDACAVSSRSGQSRRRVEDAGADVNREIARGDVQRFGSGRLHPTKPLAEFTGLIRIPKQLARSVESLENGDVGVTMAI